MTSSTDLHGIYVPLITPFTADDRPGLADIERLCHQVLEAGAAGIVALGTTGEPATLNTQEKAAVIDVIASVCQQRSAQLIIGAGTNSTAASVEAVKDAGLIEGVTALLTVVPYYTRPSEEGIVAHFKTLAQASAVPLIIYNIPYRTGRGLQASSLLELANTPNIAGLKQAVGGIDADTMKLMAEKPDSFHVLCGEDAFIYPSLCIGASGGILAASHLNTESFVSMVDLVRNGNHTDAFKIAGELLPITEALFAEPNPAVFKGVLHAQGLIETPNVRLPLMPASAKSVEQALSLVN